jgi:galactitol-specific phosphotransferase system IIC component
MALSATTLKFLLQQLSKGTIEGFIPVSSQIFNYLREEIKDNPIYNKYEEEFPKWKA